MLVQIHCVLFEVDPSDLINPAEEEHVLLMVVNHVCTDGWSEKVRIAQSSSNLWSGISSLTSGKCM